MFLYSSSGPVAVFLIYIKRRKVLKNNFFGFMSPPSVPSPSGSSASSTAMYRLFWVLPDKLGRDKRFSYMLKHFEKKRKKTQNNAITYLSLIPLFLILREFNFTNGEIFWENYVFVSKKYFYKKMSLKNLKTLRKCWGNLQPQMPKLQFLKMLIFPRAL